MAKSSIIVFGRWWLPPICYVVRVISFCKFSSKALSLFTILIIIPHLCSLLWCGVKDSYGKKRHVPIEVQAGNDQLQGAQKTCNATTHYISLGSPICCSISELLIVNNVIPQIIWAAYRAADHKYYFISTN